ncbi:MAG: response regulator transcription factor [Lachnospiraceae bacterium]|nr:response regulator transcription factor [Bacillota bacterium]MDD7254239.1 response regulator transcription factor [Bacillota bacterium]MDY2949792.1 response regulator transcription factor [Lachnospiraceae bacterium]
MDRKIKVLIAEDMEPIRRKYVKIINASEDLEVVSDVESGEEAVKQAKERKPDVILMDIEMETPDAGIRATQRILQDNPDVRIIILTVYEEDELIFTAFQLGVCDYILKNASQEEIIKSIHNAYENHCPLRPEIASRILGEFKRVRSYETSFLYAVNIVSTLTTTELEILGLLLEGKTRKEICSLRQVEMSTVKTQIHNILQKFNKTSMDEIIDMINNMNLNDFIFKKVKL